MEWNGMERNGMKWNEMEWNGVEWSGVEWNGVEWNGLEWNRLEWKWKWKWKWNGLLKIDARSSQIEALGPPKSVPEATRGIQVRLREPFEQQVGLP